MNEKELLELTRYVFRDALITYNRVQGFRNPIESADADIKKFIDKIKK